jgi:hypothetical protein
MAAPTKPAYVKKALANLEPSTHGTNAKSRNVSFCAASRGRANLERTRPRKPIHERPAELEMP